MAKKHKSLGDLSEIITHYKDALTKAKKVEFFDDTTGTFVVVKKATVDGVVAKLDEANKKLGDICQQAVLAIRVEE